MDYTLKNLNKIASFLDIEVGDSVYITRANSKEYIDESIGPWNLEIAGFSLMNIGKQKGFYIALSKNDGLPYVTKRVNLSRVGKDLFFNKESVEYAYKKGYIYMKNNPTIFILKDSKFIDIDLERMIKYEY